MPSSIPRAAFDVTTAFAATPNSGRAGHFQSRRKPAPMGRTRGKTAIKPNAEFIGALPRALFGCGDAVIGSPSCVRSRFTIILETHK